MGTNSSPEYPWPGGTPGAEAPDPVAGKPGHFAWSRWIKQYVKNLNTNLMAHQDSTNPHPNWNPPGGGGGGGGGGLDEATANGLYVNVTGDSMTGSLILVGDPTAALEATTKQYTDTKASILVGTASPSAAVGQDGQYYLDQDDHILYGPKKSVSFQPIPDPSIVGYTQFSDTAGSVFTFAAPAGVQEGDLLVAFLNSQPSGLGASTIDGWYDVGKWDSATLGGNVRWAQIVCRWYQASDPGPWTLAVNASHAGQRKIGTLVAVRNTTPPTAMPLYNSPSDTTVSVAVAAATKSLLIANWHGVMSAPNKGTLLTNSGSLVVSKGYPVTDGSNSSDWQHVISQMITGGAGTLSLSTTGPTYAAEKTTGALFARYPDPNPIDPYVSVDDMLTRQPFYWAHRGGSESTWGEHSQYTYDRAVQWGAPVLEISLNRTSDGVWFALHDQYINRTSPTAPANSDPSTMTWAQVNAYTQTYPGIANVPYLRLDTFLARYKDSGVLIVVDPKYRSGTTLWTELVNQVLASFPANKVIAKGYYNGTAWATYARSRGMKTWGYLYSADIPNLPPFVTNWDILGLDISCTLGEWNTVLAHGKPVVGHIVSDMAEATDALTKGAVGLQVANIPAVIPRKALPSEAGDPWPIALNGSGSGGSGGGGLDQATADTRYVNVTGDTITGPTVINNADRLLYGLTINRTVPSTSTSDAEIFRVNYQGLRATWTNEKGNLRTSNEGAKGEVAMKIIAAATAEGGTGNMLEVLDIAGNVQARIGPLGRMNFNKGIRMVGDTIEVQDSTGADTSTISQALGADLVIAPKNNLSVNSKRITSLAAPSALTDAATKQYVDNDNTTRLKKAGDSMTGFLYLPASKAGSSQFRLPLGAAPTTPVDGDIWTTTAGLFVQINGATVGPLGGGGGGGLSLAGGTMVDDSIINWANNGGIKTNGGVGGAYAVGSAFTVKSAAALNLTGTSGIVMNGGSGHLNVNYMRIMNVEEPVSATHAATKNYVDTKLAGKITVGTTAPSSPAVGDIWIDTN